MAKPVVITLTVTNAETLYNYDNPSQAQVEALCTLADDNGGSSPDGNIEHFTSDVYISRNVKWQGETPTSGYTVAITEIVYEPNPNDPNDVNFFTSFTSSGGRSANINANVQDLDTLDGKHDVYTIKFSVYKSGNDWKPFQIDPKLRANPNTTS